MCKTSLRFYELFLTMWVFLASCYSAINLVNVWSNGKLYATKLWHNNWKVGIWMRHLVMQQQIFINKIHVWQVQSYS